jgi:RHH-type rel operon transcriptional repressor/antitoxin RelB
MEAQMIALQLPSDIERRLEQLAETTGQSVSSYAEQALLNYLDDLEDIALAEQRLVDLAAGRTETISLEKVMAKYGLAD